MFCFSPVSEVIFTITSAVKDVCGKPPTERRFLDKYGRICLCLDEIVWKVRRHARQCLVKDHSSFLKIFCLLIHSTYLRKTSFYDIHNCICIYLVIINSVICCLIIFHKTHYVFMLVIIFCYSIHLKWYFVLFE